MFNLREQGHCAWDKAQEVVRLVRTDLHRTGLRGRPHHECDRHQGSETEKQRGHRRRRCHPLTPVRLAQMGGHHRLQLHFHRHRGSPRIGGPASAPASPCRTVSWLWDCPQPSRAGGRSGSEPPPSHPGPGRWALGVGVPAASSPAVTLREAPLCSPHRGRLSALPEKQVSLCYLCSQGSGSHGA